MRDEGMVRGEPHGACTDWASGFTLGQQLNRTGDIEALNERRCVSAKLVDHQLADLAVDTGVEDCGLVACKNQGRWSQRSRCYSKH